MPLGQLPPLQTALEDPSGLLFELPPPSQYPLEDEVASIQQAEAPTQALHFEADVDEPALAPVDLKLLVGHVV
jgi:hypothetical protein